MSHCVKIVFRENFGDVKKEVFEKKIVFLFLFFMLVNLKQKNEKKKEMEKAKQPYKNSFF